MIGSMSKGLHARSVALVRHLNVNMPSIVFAWVAIAGLACAVRAAFPATPVPEGVPGIAAMLPYILVVCVPAVVMLAALRWFPAGELYAQPEIRLARYGRWRPVDCLTSRSLPLFGATGIMASLLLGMLINIPVRVLEFIVAIPAIGGSGPEWFVTLFTVMLADVVVLTSLYAFAFVLALRHVPWFPRFLLLVWGIDLVAQIGVAQIVSGTAGLPADVATALHALLEGNLKKVLISLTLWLPYLLISERVNVTYRQRVRAG